MVAYCRKSHGHSWKGSRETGFNLRKDSNHGVWRKELIRSSPSPHRADPGRDGALRGRELHVGWRKRGLGVGLGVGWALLGYWVVLSNADTSSCFFVTCLVPENGEQRGYMWAAWVHFSKPPSLGIRTRTLRQPGRTQFFTGNSPTRFFRGSLESGILAIASLLRLISYILVSFLAEKIKTSQIGRASCRERV